MLNLQGLVPWGPVWVYEVCEGKHGKIAVGDDVGAVVDLGDSLALDVANRPGLGPPGPGDASRDTTL